MKRPEKYATYDIHSRTVTGYGNVYLATDIDPLLDELEAYRKIIPDPYATIGGGRIEVGNAKPFPSLGEFEKWYENTETSLAETIHDYFSQFQYEKTVYPKVGNVVEFSDDRKQWEKDAFGGYCNENGIVWPFIRPVTKPTREEVIEMYKIKPEHLEILKG